MNLYQSKLLEKIKPRIEYGFEGPALSIETTTLVTAIQTHSADVVWIKEMQQDKLSGDALITNAKNRRIAVLTADCVPALIYVQKPEMVAAIHAGWRGVLGNILPKTLQELKKSKADTKDIFIVFGPCLQACCFQVEEAMLPKFPASTWHAAERTHVRQENWENNRKTIDLPEVLRLQALQVGIPVENLETSSICTYQEKNLESYRQGQHYNKNISRNYSWISLSK